VLTRGSPLALLTGLPFVVASLLLAMSLRELRAQRSRTGRFVIDGAKGTLEHEGHGTHALADVTRVYASSRFAAALRMRSDAGWWIVVDVRGEAPLRVARAAWPEVARTLAALGSLGLPVEGLEPGVLLRAASCAISRPAPGVLIFSNEQRAAKILAPAITVFWGFLAALMLVGPIVSGDAASLCVLPLGAFFCLGIGIGVRNTLLIHRRTGVFTIDAEQRTITRGADTRPFSRVTGAAAGSPGPFGLLRGDRAPLGPTVIEVAFDDGARWMLFQGQRGDVRYAADVVRSTGLQVEG
jgi:hypothetical protein